MNARKDILSRQGGGEVVIRTGKPGDLGYIAYRHAVLYEKEYNLDPVFETYVLDSLLKYAKSSQEGTIWVAESNGQIAGFIAIVGIDGETAQLRWFLIEPEFRGIGLGRRLMTIAMDYCCDKKYKKVFLWTFHGLDTACHLYKTHGFVLTEQVRNDSWNKGVMEERWELTSH
jgi:GNAT superfamily N-acetyltransferase